MERVNLILSNLEYINCINEIVENLDKEALKKSRGVIGFNYCEQIYKLEKEIRETYSSNEDYYDIRFNIRKEKLEPILDNFIEYVEAKIKNALLGEVR